MVPGAETPDLIRGGMTRLFELSFISARRLSDLGSVGCKLAAAVHFLPASCPIAQAMGLRIRQNLSSLGPIFASTPQVRQPPRQPRAGSASCFWTKSSMCLTGRLG